MVGSAGAAEFSINPTRIHLDRERAIETVALSNADTRPLSFEVQIKRWTMADDGSWTLQPSDELVVHPLLFTVQPGQETRLRVGTLSPEVDAERAYRLELQQLPGEESDKGVQVELLTRISVPVFVQVPAPKIRASLVDVSMGADGLHFVLANIGDQYLPPQEGSLRLLDARGKPVHEATVSVNYVLAGARLPLTVPAMPAAACARTVKVELQLPEAGGTVAAKLPAGARRCGG